MRFKDRLFLIYTACFVSVTRAILTITLEVKPNGIVMLPCLLPAARENNVTASWFCEKLGPLTYGMLVLQRPAWFDVRRPSSREWNLNIRRASLSLMDTYTCKTSRGETLSVITLKERSRMPVTLTPVNFTMPVELGSSLVLPCRLPTNVSGSAQWLSKRRGLIRNNWRFKTENSAPNEWNLHIQMMTFDLLDTFICQTDQGVNVTYITLQLDMKCLAGRFGQHCQMLCECMNSVNSSCHHETGQCLCEPGWTGRQCDQECAYGKYGQDCGLECNCAKSVNLSCSSTGGQCYCKPGWTGLKCDRVTGDIPSRVSGSSSKKKKGFPAVPTLLAIAGIIIATLAFIVVTIVLYRRFMRAKNLNEALKDTQELTPASNESVIANSFANETYSIV